MIILEENGKEILIELPCGTKTVISTEDKWILSEFPVWGMTGSRSRYAFAERSFKTDYSTLRERVYLHRLVVKPQGKEQVDHIDRNRLNNKRDNLRICNARQNMANVAPLKGRKYKGVHFQDRKLKKPYRSYIAYIDAKSRGQKKRKYLGYFETEEEAARAYDKAAKEIWGEFAFLNFPEK